MSSGRKLLHQLGSMVGYVPNNQEIRDELWGVAREFFGRSLKKELLRLGILVILTFTYALLVKWFIVDRLTGMNLWDYLFYPILFLRKEMSF